MKVRKSWIGSKKPATLGDLSQLHEDMSIEFEKTRVATKQDLKDFEKRQDEKQEQYKQDIIREFHSSVELQKADLEGAHQDELASVEGKKDAPVQWKSLPRRLTTVEMDVEKIKDHLEIS